LETRNAGKDGDVEECLMVREYKVRSDARSAASFMIIPSGSRSW
jgi:hypothetical protein